MLFRSLMFPLCASLMLGACDIHIDSKDLEHAERHKAELADTPEISRPVFPIDTDRAYDPDSVAAYAGEHAEVYAHIDQSLPGHTEALQRWMRQRSISAQNDGIQEMAEMLRADLEALGFQETALVPTDGHPGVWGHYDVGAEKTLLVYMMYDVQLVNPEDWDSPPFEANIVDH